MRSVFAAWLSIAWLAGAGCAEACSPAAWQPHPSAVLGLSGVAPGSAGHATHRTAAPEHRAPRDGAPVTNAYSDELYIMATMYSAHPVLKPDQVYFHEKVI